MAIPGRTLAAGIVLFLALDLRAGAVSDFAAFLAADDPTTIGELLPEAVDASATWVNALDVIDRYECIAIESAHAEDAGDNTLRVTIRGTGLTAGIVRREEPLPAVWFLRINGNRIVEVKTAEQKNVDAILAATDAVDLAALIDERVDLNRLSMMLAWHAAEPYHGEHGFRAIELARHLGAAIGDRNRVEYATQMESTLYTMLGRNDEAIRTAMESLDETLACCDADTVSNAWFTAAVAHWAINDIPSATEYFRQGAAVWESMTQLRPAIRAHVNLGHLESSRGRFRSALASASEAERMAGISRHLRGQLDALIMQNYLHAELGNNLVAKQTGMRALELARRLRRREATDMVLGNNALAALKRGDYAEAVAGLSVITTSDELVRRHSLALALEKVGRDAEAVAMLECLAEEHQPEPASGAAGIALSQRALRDGDPALALELARRAMPSIVRAGTDFAKVVIHPWEAQAAEGAALRALGRRGEARLVLEEAIDAIETGRDAIELAAATHADYYSGKTQPYHDLIALLLDDDRVAEAVRLSERLKASVLDDIRSGRRADVGSRLTPDEHAAQERLEQEMARLNRESFQARRDPKRAAAVEAALADTRARWEQLETTLQARHGALAARPRVDPLRSPRLLLPGGDDVLLDFVVSPERTIVFVFSRRGEELSIARHIIAAGEDALARDVDRFLNRLASGSLDYDDDARRLHRLLLAPAAAQLRGAKRIGIVADGPLSRLPFQVLQGSDGEPLAARQAIFYAPSLESLLQPAAKTVERPAVLAIGNPRFGGEAAALMRARTRDYLGDLPDAGVEARTIARMYDDAQLLTGAEATESALKEHAGEFDVLHIAAHAVTDDAQPLYSAIMLAPDPSREGEDGILEAREITRLPLRARLAVISACSTAQGQVRPGEGIIGLSWAFLVAGCPTIVASQWRVPSASTARLMIEFHRELSRGAAPPEALQRAQVTMMSDRRYRHPFHWAAFVVVGAGR